MARADTPQCRGLQESFEDFFETSHVGFVLTDPDGDVLRANTCFADWVGSDPGSLKGCRFAEFLTAAGRIYYDTHLGPLLRMQGFFAEIALDLLGPDGARIPVLVNALERRDETGAPMFVRMTVIKATERRRYERELLAARNELRELNATLEKRLASEGRERLSLEAWLARERETATLREQFIAILGHDLRNPLAAIDAGLRLLEREQDAQRAAAIVGQMRASVERMSMLIRDVMDFARARLGGGLAVERRSVALQPHLHQVVQELQVAHPGRIIHSDFSLPGTVVCDPGRLAQLLSNLLANALAHGDPEGPVSVGAFLEADSLELSVTNLGDPIPSDARERLFEPFVRAEHRAGNTGLGLGLYIASQIAHAHGGELLATSTPEETRFTLRMPAG